MVQKFKDSIEELLRQVDANASTAKNIDPETRKKITFVTESELFKYKRKLYKYADNNMGDGFSQFFDDSTRRAILAEVKKDLVRKNREKILQMLSRAHQDGAVAEVLDDNEQMLKLLEDSVQLLRADPRE